MWKFCLSFTFGSPGNKIPAMNLDWCCEDFRERLFHDDGRQDGLGIFVLFRSKVPPLFQLEYRRPNRKPPEAIAEDGIRLKFCPWCGRNLLEHYGSDARLLEEELMYPIGQIEHAAVWVSDLERARAFYERWFKATAGAKYSSSKRDFTSYFLSLGSGARLELMTSPGEAARPAHLAVSVGSRSAVDSLVKSMEAAGVHVLSGPRLTGDGYYEALVTDTEGNLLEITS
jgi:lactoylglutathione lyase